MLMVKVQPDVALAFNYFVMIMERLCRVSHDNPMQEECTQLLVPVVWGGISLECMGISLCIRSDAG